MDMLRPILLFGNIPGGGSLGKLLTAVGIALAAIIILMIIGKHLWEKLGLGQATPCVCCGATKSLYSADRLPETEQAKILGFFAEVESRDVEIEEMWVCNKCHRVYDDTTLSDRLTVLSHDGGSAFTACGLMHLCKRCDHRILSAAVGPFICPMCRTEHVWKRYADSDSEYLFLVIESG
jgi:hypothetical protein